MPPKNQHGRVAEAVGISRRTFERYRKRGCPAGPAAAVRKWRAENIKDITQPAELTIELKRAELLKTLETGRNYKLKNDETEARLVSAAEIRNDSRTAFERVSDRLSRLPAECSESVPADLQKSIGDLVDGRVRQALQELENAVEGVGKSRGADASAPTETGAEIND